MFKRFYNLFAGSIVALVLSLAFVNILPDDLFKNFPFDPISRSPVEYQPLAPQQWNTILSDKPVEFVQLNHILGPESLAFSREGLIYTGLADGRLIELDPSKNNKIRQVLRFKQSPECKDNVALQPVECGRFLQLRFKNVTLYAVESGTGLYSIDIKSGSKKLLGPTPPLSDTNLYNSFVFDPVEPNLAYISISSTKWNLQNIIWSFLELEASGQLIALDTSTGKRVILLDKLMIANGVDVDVKRDRLLLSETSKSQVDSISLTSVRSAFKKAKDGDSVSSLVEKVPLIPMVPGNPDNIIIQGDVAHIALPFVKVDGKDRIDRLAPMEHLRKTIGRIMYGSGLILKYIVENFYYNPALELLYKDLLTGHLNYRLMNTDRSAVLEYNLESGESRLLGSQMFSYISEALQDNDGYMWLGSFRSPFIVKTKV